jgi:hypothetical protein
MRSVVLGARSKNECARPQGRHRTPTLPLRRWRSGIAVTYYSSALPLNCYRHLRVTPPCKLFTDHRYGLHEFSGVMSKFEIAQISGPKQLKGNFSLTFGLDRAGSVSWGDGNNPTGVLYRGVSSCNSYRGGSFGYPKASREMSGEVCRNVR